MLTCEWTEGGRRAKLQKIGFDKTLATPSLSFDHLVALLAVCALPLLALQSLLAGYGGGRGCPVEGCLPAALLVGAEFCLAALAGTWVAFRAIERRRTGAGTAFRPLALALLGAVLAVAASVFLRAVFRGLALLTLPEARPLAALPGEILDGLGRQRPFLIFPFAITLLVGRSAASISEPPGCGLDNSCRSGRRWAGRPCTPSASSCRRLCRLILRGSPSRRR